MALDGAKLLGMGRNVTVRILERTTSNEQGCWVWEGAKQPNGYGKLKVQGRTELVHRAAYEAWVGPIPDGWVVDHKCSNRACCNPEHLEAVEQRENTIRGIQRLTRTRMEEQ